MKQKTKIRLRVLALFLCIVTVLNTLPTPYVFAEPDHEIVVEETGEVNREGDPDILEENEGIENPDTPGENGDIEENIEENPDLPEMNGDVEGRESVEDLEPIEGQSLLEEGVNQPGEESQASNMFSMGIMSEPVDLTGESDIKNEMNITYKLKGNSTIYNLVSGTTIENSEVEKFYVEFSFTLEDNEVEGQHNRIMNEGDYYFIDLPNEISLLNPPTGENIINSADTGTPLAGYEFIQDLGDGSWKIKITFKEAVDAENEYELEGHLNFEFELDLSGWPAGTSDIVRIPIGNGEVVEIDVKTPEPAPTTPSNLVKTESSYNEELRQLVWNVRIEPATGIFEGYTFKDTLDDNLELLSIKHGNEELNPDDYTVSPTGEIEYIIKPGFNGADFQNIQITTRVNAEVYESSVSTTITNTATLTDGDPVVNLTSNTSSKVIKPVWIEKEGTLYQGNKILWTITANKTNQQLYNGVITDVFSNDLNLDTDSVKIDGVEIDVYDSGDALAIAAAHADSGKIYGIYDSSTPKNLKVYLPRGIDKAASKEWNLTLVTEVEPDDDPGNKTVENNASLTGEFVTGTGVGTSLSPGLETGIIGVGVPDIAVHKSHETIGDDNKRDGTINWTITAVSSHSDYASSKIVDTLPSDQTYVEDSVYWVNGDLYLNNTTEPSAVISGEGRILTIAFTESTHDRILETQQTFRVQTKINEEIYGDNINRNFTNRADGYLYEDNNVEGTPLATHHDTDSVNIRNTVISKSSGAYSGNPTNGGVNPRVNFSIVINSNRMPLTDVVVIDNLDKLVMEFKGIDDSDYAVVSGVKWTYVPGTLTIAKAGTAPDDVDIPSIIVAAQTAYDKDINNVLTMDFGETVANQYTITFTAEVDVDSNTIFKENGTIRAKGNEATINGGKIKGGTLTVASGEREVSNDVLKKSGVHDINEQQVTWTINLNQHRVELDNTRVVDVLQAGLTLDPTSIELYTDVIDSAGNFVTGTAIEGRTKVTVFDYTYLPATGEGQEGQYILTVDLPENKKDYILRFATDIDKSLLGHEIENTAYYEGESAQENKTGRTSFMLASSSGGNSSKKASIVVNKTSKDTGDRVDGAIFELNWLRGGDINDPVFVRRLSAIGSGSVTFYGLTIDEKYTITEVGAPDGYLLDSDDPVEVIAGTDTGIEFSNTPIKSGSWEPKAIKKLTGTSVWLPFAFEIIDDATGETVITGTTGAVSGSDRAIDFSIISGVDKADILEFEDSHTFGEAESAGTEYQVTEKTFTMKEVTTSSPGYTYDTTEHKLTVSVYNVKGRANLKVIVEDENGTIISDEDGNILTENILEFTNIYNAEGVVQFIASKTLKGHSLAENQFQFELYEGAGTDPGKLIETISNGESIYNDGRDYRASAEFTPISYDETDVGTKIYTIVEKQEVNPGYTYDEAIYTIEVEVTHDDGTGVVESEITSIEKTVDGVSEIVTEISFTNTYQTTDTDADITATKILSGDVLKDQDFFFRLAQVSSTGNFIQEIETVKNNGSNITFTTLDFIQEDKDKTFYYQVTEIPEDRPGYDFDDSVFTVEIKVIDNQDGTLSTEKTITKDGEEVNQIVFQNTYSSTGILSLTAKKVLEGKTLEDNQFSFEVQELDALKGNPVGEKQLVKNDGKGMIVFPELSYTEADSGKTFYYRLSEVNDNQKGYTYDDTLYMVSITVTDNKDGTLNIEKEVVTPENITDIIFKNSYKADEVNNTGQNTDGTNSPTLIERILSPKTGDSLPIMVYAAVILVSSLGLVYLGYKRKRNKL